MARAPYQAPRALGPASSAVHARSTSESARGAYLRRLGDTPGHVHHWSHRDLARLLAPYGELVRLRGSLPWTLALVRLA